MNPKNNPKYFIFSLGQRLTSWRLQPKLQQLLMFLLPLFYNCNPKISKILCQPFNLCCRRKTNQLLLLLPNHPKKNIVRKKIAPLPPNTPPRPPPSQTLIKPVWPAPALPNVVHKSMPCALNFERNTRTTQSCRPKTKKDNFPSLTYIAQLRTLFFVLIWKTMPSFN